MVLSQKPPLAPGRFPFTLHTLQVSPHVCRILVTQVAIFFQCLIDDPSQLRRNIAIETNWGPRIGVSIALKMSGEVSP